MGPTEIAILAAVTMEAKAIASGLQMPPPGPGRPTSTRIGALTIHLHLVGIGASGLKSIDWEATPRCLVMAGVAGALDPTLKVGDVVLINVPADAVQRLKAFSGKIHTSSEIVCTPNQKSELFRATGALAVDMETAIVERWARQRNIPFIAVRAISDASSDELDPRLLSLVDPWGRPRAGRVAHYLLSNPLRAGKLAKLGANSKKAAKHLGIAIRELVNDMAATPDNL